MKIQNNPLQKQAVRTRGLTLIELVVVLAVLVALVGMVLAFFPDIVRKASASTSANTSKDIGRTLQIKFTTQQTYGNGYDNLAAGAAALADGLVGYGPFRNATNLVIAKPTTQDVTAFQSVGISGLYSVAGTNTFSLTRVAQPLADTLDVVTLAPTAPSILSLAPDAVSVTNRVYYLFGLGQPCTAVGPGGFQDAPVRAGEVAIDNPVQRYGHYGVIFMTEPGAIANTRRVSLLGVVALAYDGIRPVSTSLQSYYN